MSEINKRWSKDIGGCNGCSRHITDYGAVDIQVWEIILRTISFRLCAVCFIKLREQMQAELIPAIAAEGK